GGGGDRGRHRHRKTTMAVMIGYNSSVGVTCSLLNEGYNDRSGRLREFEIAKSVKRADAKIRHQHQESYRPPGSLQKTAMEQAARQFWI
ncbi:MAG: hypothetical protein J0H75_08870, partial [Rhizobiales bacterium]|nr:hypothetical protein [Hyphomicrobiales bacterium]